MNKRRLGTTSLELTEIGFGAWAIGGAWTFGWGAQDDDEAVRAIERAIDLGINWIDTAAVYGLGHSEELVAKAVAGKREDIIIATKCSLIWDESGKTSCYLAADSIIRECEASLGRLQTDHIDLYQIHWPDDEAHIDEGWEAIGRLIATGKVRYGGVSNFNVAQLRRVVSVRPIASLQPPYSMLRRGVEDEILGYCRESNIGVIAYSPLQCGLLTGRFDMARVAPDDWRRRSAEFREPNLAINLGFATELKKLASRYSRTAGQLAVAWVLRDQVITSAIVGARSAAQVEENVGGSGWTIEPEVLAEIDDLLADRILKIRAANGTIRR